MQQKPHIEKNDPEEEISCLKLTLCNVRRKLGVKFKIDVDNLNSFVYC